MAKMFIANCTRQNWTLLYTLPEHKAPRTQQVEAGGQLQISGDLQPEDVAAIVAQYEVYAMIPASEVHRAKTQISLLYNVGAPVTRNQMMAALERNLVLMDARGRQLRDAAAVAVADGMERENPREFREAEFTVRQERDDGGVPDVNEIIKVPRQGGELPTQPRRKRRAAA